MTTARRYPAPCARVALLTTLALPAAAQTTYDDFSGAALDSARWFPFGPTTRLTQSGGRLRFAGIGTAENLGVAAIDLFRADFELVLDFDGFAAGALNGEPGMLLYVFDAGGAPFAGAEMRIGLEARPSGRWYYAEAEKNGGLVSANSVPATQNAGQLRLVRSGNDGTVSFRESGQTNWTVAGQWTNLFCTDTVHLIVEAEAGTSAAVDFAADRVSYTGTRITGSPGYGRRCHGLGATGLGQPRSGNADFGVLGIGGAAFAGAPLLMALGASATSLDLTPLRAPGCTLLASPDLVFPGPFLDPEGIGFMPVPIPTSRFLIGRDFFFQLVAATNQNPLGLAWSDGVRSRIAP